VCRTNNRLCGSRAETAQQLRAPQGPVVIDHREEGMKNKLLITVICVLALLLSTSAPAFAAGDIGATSVAVDVVVARPVSFALTIVGSVLFVASLPVALTAGCVDKTAHTLVVVPGKDTFTRPLGDFQDFLEF
jgi:hypothetical protein